MNQTTKQTGGIIVAAKKKIWENQAHFMRPVGSISAIKRIVLTFLKAEISPIVIITGYDADVIEHELATYSIIFIKTKNYDQLELLAHAQAGIQYLQGKCDQVLFTPVDMPLFSPDTLVRLTQMDALAAAPSYKRKGGHPILLSSELFPNILSYRGDGGIVGALQASGIERQWLEVEDRGILSSLDHLEQDAELISAHNELLFRPFLRVWLEKDTSFMGGRIKLLLMLIDETHSVSEACAHIPVSYSKAWKMLNHLEKELGYEVVARKQGGKHGGKTGLTPAGKKFLEDYSTFEYRVRQFAMEEFEHIFINPQSRSN